MQKILLVTLIFIPATLFFTGCQTVPYQGQARDVKKKPLEGGVLALPLDPKDEDRMKAEQKMKQTCLDKEFKILEEGEVVVGQKTNTTASEDNRDNSQKKVGMIFGLPLMSGQKAGKDMSSSSTTENIKEWQISYECNRAKTVR